MKQILFILTLTLSISASASWWNGKLEIEKGDTIYLARSSSYKKGKYIHQHYRVSCHKDKITSIVEAKNLTKYYQGLYKLYKKVSWTAFVDIGSNYFGSVTEHYGEFGTKIIAKSMSKCKSLEKKLFKLEIEETQGFNQ